MGLAVLLLLWGSVGIWDHADAESVLCSAMFGFFFAKGPISCFEDAQQQADTAKFGRFHRGMLEHGVYLAPSQYEAGFVGLKHSEEDIDATIAAARAVLKDL